MGRVLLWEARGRSQTIFYKAQSVLLPEFSHMGEMCILQPAAFERLITSYYDSGVTDASLCMYQPLAFKPIISLTFDRQAGSRERGSAAHLGCCVGGVPPL